MPYFNAPYQPYNNVPDQLMQMRQQQYQPQYQQQCAPQQTQPSNIIWVPSEAVARNYLVAPNSSVTMWNENGMEIYLKKADSSGRPEFEVYDVVKRVVPPPQPSNPNDEVITLSKLMAVLTNLGLMPGKFTKEAKEEAVNE